MENDKEKCMNCPIRFECEDNAERYEKKDLEEGEEKHGNVGTAASRV